MPGAERDWERRIGGRLKLRDLHILSMVVQWGSMAKAATHLAMSQPAVSEAIANLEAALKVNLLDRNVRGVEPTIYATALLKRDAPCSMNYSKASRRSRFSPIRLQAKCAWQRPKS